MNKPENRLIYPLNEKETFENFALFKQHAEENGKILKKIKKSLDNNSNIFIEAVLVEKDLFDDKICKDINSNDSDEYILPNIWSYNNLIEISGYGNRYEKFFEDETVKKLNEKNFNLRLEHNYCILFFINFDSQNYLKNFDKSFYNSNFPKVQYILNKYFSKKFPHIKNNNVSKYLKLG